MRASRGTFFINIAIQSSLFWLLFFIFRTKTPTLGIIPVVDVVAFHVLCLIQAYLVSFRIPEKLYSALSGVGLSAVSWGAGIDFLSYYSDFFAKLDTGNMLHNVFFLFGIATFGFSLFLLMRGVMLHLAILRKQIIWSRELDIRMDVVVLYKKTIELLSSIFESSAVVLMVDSSEGSEVFFAGGSILKKHFKCGDLNTTRTIPKSEFILADDPTMKKIFTKAEFVIQLPISKDAVCYIGQTRKISSYIARKPYLIQNLHVFLHYIFKAHKLHFDLTEAYNRDSLTGAYSREGILKIIQRCVDARTPFSLVMIDIDNLKKINDTHGHSIGDEFLRHFASRLQANLRSEDSLGRFGGDEFIIIMRKSNYEESRSRMEKIYSQMKANPFTPRDLPKVRIPVSYSFGISTWAEGKSIDDIIRDSDERMYAMKRTYHGGAQKSESLRNTPDSAKGS